MMHWIKRLGYGLLFALPLMMVSYALVQAADAPQVSEPDKFECATCHAEFQEAWQSGAHGQALEDPAFKTAWLAAGQTDECLDCHVTGYDPDSGTWMADGVTCEACHGELTDNHPVEPMSMDKVGKVCSDCHQETYFEWQVSGHGEKDLNCVDCHDPHMAGLKAKDETELCASCHQGRSSNFAHTEHSLQGLACVDCHMSQNVPSGAEGHSKYDHTFFVNLETCTDCHVGQMHDSVEKPAVAHEDTQAVDAMAAVEAAPVSADPVPVSPVGFTALAGLVGIAFGIIITPQIEKFRHKK